MLRGKKKMCADGDENKTCGHGVGIVRVLQVWGNEQSSPCSPLIDTSLILNNNICKW